MNSIIEDGGFVEASILYLEYATKEIKIILNLYVTMSQWNYLLNQETYPPKYKINYKFYFNTSKYMIGLHF